MPTHIPMGAQMLCNRPRCPSMVLVIQEVIGNVCPMVDRGWSMSQSSEEHKMRKKKINFSGPGVFPGIIQSPTKSAAARWVRASMAGLRMRGFNK